MAVVVPASGFSALSPKCTLIRSMSTARISLAICPSEDAWPPPTSGTPQRTVREPSIWNPIQAAALSFSHTSRP